jgi:hypothetical protein
MIEASQMQAASNSGLCFQIEKFWKMAQSTRMAAAKSNTRDLASGDADRRAPKTEGFAHVQAETNISALSPQER